MDLQISSAQRDSLVRISQKWDQPELATPEHWHHDAFEIVPESDLPRGSYLGTWVGEPCNGNPGRMYLGVEVDGHTHS